MPKNNKIKQILQDLLKIAAKYSNFEAFLGIFDTQKVQAHLKNCPAHSSPSPLAKIKTQPVQPNEEIIHPVQP